jgi:hypothetical protein
MEKIIAMSCWSKGGNGEYPVRFVVTDRGMKPAHRYARHMQVNDGKNEDYFIYGHYMSTLIDALVDAQKSVRENQADFKPGNVSHIPSWPTGELIRRIG